VETCKQRENRLSKRTVFRVQRIQEALATKLRLAKRNLVFHQV